MKLNYASIGLTIAVAAFSVTAQAAQHGTSSVSCTDSFATTSNVGYISCQGPAPGNIAANQNTVATFAGFGSFTYAGASDVGTGTFMGNPSGATSGTLTFASPQTGNFVLGIKGANNYSLYLFDGGSTGISTLDFDTFGIAKGNGMAGPGLSHAVLFTSAVPEPETWALMLGGLFAIGMFARRQARG
jgi:hypothetical protein